MRLQGLYRSNRHYDMTLSRSTPALVLVDVDAAVAALRARGLRVSAARRLVLEALFLADGPVSADQLAEGLAGRITRSDLTSVYRNLETLEQLGIVRHVHLGHGPGLYTLAESSEREYLLCESCDAVQVVEPGSLERARAAIEEALGFRARFSHFPIVGLCSTCLERSES